MFNSVLNENPFYMILIMTLHVRDGQWLEFHVTIYHDSNCHDNQYYHDILLPTQL